MDRPSTSASLLDGIRSGLHSSWSRFVRVYGPVIYARCRGIGCSDTDSRDISQEVLLRIHKSIGGFQPDEKASSFTRWLSIVVRNAVMDHHRKCGRSPQARGGTGFQGILNNQPADDDESFSFAGESTRTLVVRNTLNVIRTDFAPQTWQAFLKHGVEGHPAPDVAEELGIKPAAVRQAKRRVMKRLQDELDGLLD